MSVKFCLNCGHENPNTRILCGSCGQRIIPIAQRESLSETQLQRVQRLHRIHTNGPITNDVIWNILGALITQAGEQEHLNTLKNHRHMVEIQPDLSSSPQVQWTTAEITQAAKDSPEVSHCGCTTSCSWPDGPMPDKCRVQQVTNVQEVLLVLRKLHDTVDQFNADTPDGAFCWMCANGGYAGDGIIHKDDCPLILARAVLDPATEVKKND